MELLYIPAVCNVCNVVGINSNLPGNSDMDTVSSCPRHSFSAFLQCYLNNLLCMHSGQRQTCPDPAAFADAMQLHFAKLETPSRTAWADTQFNNASDALSAVLEMVRQHQVHQAVAKCTSPTTKDWTNPTCRYIGFVSTSFQAVHNMCHWCAKHCVHDAQPFNMISSST